MIMTVKECPLPNYYSQRKGFIWYDYHYYYGQGKFVISLYVFHEDNPGGHDGQGLKSSGGKRRLV